MTKHTEDLIQKSIDIPREKFIIEYVHESNKLKEKIEALEKENTELKKWKKDTIKARGNDYMAWSKMYDKLTKAKDLIRNLLRVTYGEGWNYSLDWKVKAEKFLKEE